METAMQRVTDIQTQTEVEDAVDTPEPPVLRLRLKKPKKAKKVDWQAGTVDNEHMGRKKSKCCCIYKKPTVFGESSSESDEECEHCFGHPEKRRRNRKPDENMESPQEEEHQHEGEQQHNEEHQHDGEPQQDDKPKKDEEHPHEAEH